MNELKEAYRGVCETYEYYQMIYFSNIDMLNTHINIQNQVLRIIMYRVNGGLDSQQINNSFYDR